MPLDDQLTPEEQAQFEEMRAADGVPQTIEPTTPAETEPEAGAETPQPEATADRRPQMVPHAALHEERERRKSVEAQLAEERKARQALDERTNLLLQRMGSPAPAAPQSGAPAIPDVEKDPVGHILGQIQQRDQVLQAVVQQLTQRQQVDQQAIAIQQVKDAATSAEREFRAQTQDYDAAVAYLIDSRSKEMELAGYDPVQRQTILAQEALNVAHRAIQQNRNPAQMIYDLAKLRGYQAKAQEADTAAQPDTAARLARVAQGQREGRNLGQARGNGPAPLTAQRLAEMSDAEFDRMMATPEGRELMGA
ncbi:MAG: hypothetical protein KGL26_17075 [Pseudomonadota bacterium]|nr:hypothetical protein [Pseudomonadota bacterium]